MTKSSFMTHVRPAPRRMRQFLPAAALACAAMSFGVSPAHGANGRAYELVSPPDKAGNAIDPRSTVQSSPTGDAVAFSAPGAFGGAEASISGAYYLGRRSPDAWSTIPLDAPQTNFDAQTASPTLYMAKDLSKTIQFSQRALLPGAIEGGGNLYRRDTLTGARSLLFSGTTKTLVNDFAPFTQRALTGASDDLSHFVFQTTAQLTPDAPPGVPSVYESSPAGLAIAGRLPDGSVPAGGAVMTVGGSTRTPRPMSDDGERIVFKSPATDGALYLRNGGTTKALSVSRRSGDADTPQPAQYGGASVDGNHVFFTSVTPLTDDATGQGGAGDLYRYDVPTDQLTNLTVLRDPLDSTADVGAVIHVSEDGSRVYFMSRANLSGDAISGDWNLFVATGTDATLVAPLNIYEAGGPQASVISPSGRFMVFASNATIGGVDTAGSRCKADQAHANDEGFCTEVYRFDAESGGTVCLSCDPIDGVNDFADLGPMVAGISGYIPRAVLDDGTTFFNSKARLVREDLNGKGDVYAYRDGKLSLVSSGRGDEDATLADASADGRDVFFFTSERLVAIDTDGDTDLYDARMGGGIADQTRVPAVPPRCGGDGCQGPMRAPEGLVSAGSAELTGAGNESPTARGSIAKVKVTTPKAVHGPSFALTVRAPASGRISARGTAVAKAAKSVSRAGAYRLTVKLTSKARRQLARKKAIKVRLSVAFVPTHGATSSKTVVVNVKA